MIIVVLSPLVQGLIKKLKAKMQGRIGPGILQPYYDLFRLCKKEMVISSTCSWVFKAAPYVVFGSTVAAALIIPVVTPDAPFGRIADIIALIYLFGLGRFFMALAALDAGTAFGGEGSSREMTVAILVEPMLMLSVFTAAISARSTNVGVMAQHGLFTSPAQFLALAAFLVAIVAETGRIPVDNPDTHLELTMIHEGMILEYSGRYLAIMEWSHYIKQMLLFTLAIDIFSPVGISQAVGPAGIAVSAFSFIGKILLLSAIMALAESARAKLRFFQLPSLLGGSFVLALLSLLTNLMIGR